LYGDFPLVKDASGTKLTKTVTQAGETLLIVFSKERRKDQKSWEEGGKISNELPPSNNSVPGGMK